MNSSVGLDYTMFWTCYRGVERRPFNAQGRKISFNRNIRLPMGFHTNVGEQTLTQ